ncbi:hypothetical protein OC846_001981 [Tilletia horrida]|uniref:AB hydrolase-1 domain-containing protein n=1 Tax=Tilletia horrida TaxID=155126 RepID=A0AAN6JSK4_9BASI|nr:hypothetical protein OC846_001981 [Tilletia horrida]KAK0555420.1 hypothetical protein OC845_000292 [Tilletia horrida]KAK0568812.1 hypothetical protein OC861_001589 [Tilletia horrida]
MRLFTSSTALSLLTLTAAVTSSSASASSSSKASVSAVKRHGDSHLHHQALTSSAFERRISTSKRQKQNYQAQNIFNNNPNPPFPSQEDQNNWVRQSQQDPIAAAQDVLQNSPYVYTSNLSPSQWSVNSAQTAQLTPWGDAPYYCGFISTGSATPDATGDGWISIPQDQQGFTLTNMTIGQGAVMPYYISQGADPQTVKRVIITWPGKPRDAWKYGAYAMSALCAANANATKAVTPPVPDEQVPSNQTVAIISPMWLNEVDLADGSVEPTWLSFHGSRWQSGYGAQHPRGLNHSYTTYEIMDNFTDWLFDQNQWPALKSVVVIGHSMGGQAAQRYALLKKAKPYDDNIRYWVGNPGSWGWLNTDRPFAPNDTCTDIFDEWGYGLGGNLTKMTPYGRKQVNASKTDVVNRFLSRKVHIALALMDNGAGDTHCEALTQGLTHLSRGSQFVLDVADANNGVWPETFTLDYIANTSHADFNMFSANQSLWHIFQEDIDVRYPDIGSVSNPGDPGPKKAPGTKAFATPVHKIMAYSLLLGSIAALSLAFVLLPCLFPANTNSWEESAWENESKRKLI